MRFIYNSLDIDGFIFYVKCVYQIYNHKLENNGFAWINNSLSNLNRDY